MINILTLNDINKNIISNIYINYAYYCQILKDN